MCSARCGLDFLEMHRCHFAHDCTAHPWHIRRQQKLATCVSVFCVLAAFTTHPLHGCHDEARGGGVQT